jgi:hypothetical protein
MVATTKEVTLEFIKRTKKKLEAEGNSTGKLRIEIRR